MAELPKFIKIAVILISAVLTVFLFRGRDYSQRTIKLDSSVSKLIKENGIDEKDLSYSRKETFKSGRHSFLKIEKHYKVAPEFEADEFLAKIVDVLKEPKLNVAKTVYETDGQQESFSLAVSFKNRLIYELKFLKSKHRRTAEIKSKGKKIAIVLDDFGYNMNNINALSEINLPLTISILPNLPYSKTIAEEARRYSFEVILHMPMEPYSEGLNLEEGTLMVDMQPQQIGRLLSKAIESVPGVKGISNHMGSKATENRDFMREIFNELKKRDLYFLDNLVTDKSVCKEVAEGMAVRTASRSIFLDNESDEDYIKEQVYHTTKLAVKTGWAIGVGHDRPNTIKVLTRLIPQLKKSGFDFVYLSELVR